MAAFIDRTSIQPERSDDVNGGLARLIHCSERRSMATKTEIRQGLRNHSATKMHIASRWIHNGIVLC